MIKSLVIGLICPLVFFACQDKSSLIQPKPATETGQTKDSASDDIKTFPVIELIKIEPQSPQTGDTIQAEVVLKGESDGVIYQWSKNGALMDENSNKLKTEFKRGDIIYLSATPYKGIQKGKTVNTLTHIFNSVPAIKSSSKKSKFKDDMYSYQVKAVDLDGDKLTYSLKTAPKGMEIDSSSGMIRWNIDLGKVKKAERYDVIISVSDGYGGEAEEVFNIEIGQP